MTPELQNLLDQWNKLSFSDRFIFYKTIQMNDGRNIQLGQTTGTKFGTSASQKIGFFGVTPVVQQSSIGAPGGGGTGSTDAIDQSARTAINSIRATLTALGLTA